MSAITVLCCRSSSKDVQRSNAFLRKVPPIESSANSQLIQTTDGEWLLLISEATSEPGFRFEDPV